MSFARRRTLGVLDKAITESKAVLDRSLKSVGYAAAIALGAIPALFFLTFAGFIALQDAYGTVVAALACGAAYGATALGVLALAVVARRRWLAQERAKPLASWWADPAVIATGIELVRIVGLRRLIPAAAVGVALMMALQARSETPRS